MGISDPKFNAWLHQQDPSYENAQATCHQSRIALFNAEGSAGGQPSTIGTESTTCVSDPDTQKASTGFIRGQHRPFDDELGPQSDSIQEWGSREDV
jgi:hypothetical protein